MKSNSTPVDQKDSPASYAMKKAFDALEAKNFPEAIRCSELGLKLQLDPALKYPLLNCLASAQAAQFFFDHKYQEALSCYNKAIDQIDNDRAKFNNQFKNCKKEYEKRKSLHKIISNCQTALGGLYASRSQVHSMMEQPDKAADDYTSAVYFNMGHFATKLRHTADYVLKTLNHLPQNKKLQNDLSLFRCAEKYWDGVKFYSEKQFPEALSCFIASHQFCQDVPDVLEHLAEAKLATISLHKNQDEKFALMDEVIEHASRYIKLEIESKKTVKDNAEYKMFLVRGIAHTVKEEFEEAQNNFLYAMKNQILHSGKFDQEIWALAENALRSFLVCQFQLIYNNNFPNLKLPEKKFIKEKMAQDNYPCLHQLLTNAAEVFAENQEFDIAENLYAVSLWMAMRLKMPNLESASAAVYLSCVIPRLQKNLVELDFEDVRNLKIMLAKLSEKKRVALKQTLTGFIKSIMDYANTLELENRMDMANEFYASVVMLEPEKSQYFKAAYAKLNQPKPLEPVTMTSKQKKKKNKVTPPLKLTLEESKPVVLELIKEVKPIIPKIKIDSTKEVTCISEVKIASKEDVTPLELKESIHLPAACWTISYCLQESGMKQVYATGETVCASWFPKGVTAKIEMVFGDCNPTAAIQKAFPNLVIMQDASNFKIKIHDNLIVTLRNSEAMNKAAKELEQQNLSEQTIQLIKYKAVQEDAKSRKDFRMLTLYAECQNTKVVVYSPNKETIEDFRNKRMKCNSETKQIFMEDASLAFKAVYYSHLFEIKIPPAIKEAALQLQTTDLVKAINQSTESMHQWMELLFLNGSALYHFNQLRTLHLLEKIIPEFSKLSDQTDPLVQSILIYLQCALAGCDTIVLEQSENKPDFNVIYATWICAIQLLRQHFSMQSTNEPSHADKLFDQSFSTISGDRKRKLLLAAENKWRFRFFNSALQNHNQTPETDQDLTNKSNKL